MRLIAKGWGPLRLNIIIALFTCWMWFFEPEIFFDLFWIGWKIHFKCTFSQCYSCIAWASTIKVLWFYKWTWTPGSILIRHFPPLLFILAQNRTFISYTLVDWQRACAIKGLLNFEFYLHILEYVTANPDIQLQGDFYTLPPSASESLGRVSDCNLLA